MRRILKTTPPPLIDLTGKKFGRWSVLSYAGRDDKNGYWLCLCDCGIERSVIQAQLKNGSSKSCGCFFREDVSRRMKTHGCGAAATRTREYRIWGHILSRCTNQNHHAWASYGGRGITVCQRWRTSFENFISDMGNCPSGHSIDRIDNDKGYYPENCRWATSKVQNRNRRVNKIIVVNGVSRTYSEWAEINGFSKSVIYMRLGRGWSPERAATQPLISSPRRES